MESMGMYQVAMIAHIVGTLVFFSGLFVTTAAMIGMRQATTVEKLRGWVALASRSDLLLPFGAALLLLSGLYLILTAWGWSIAWVNVSLASFLTITPLVPLGLSRRLGSVKASLGKAGAAANSGPVSATLRSATRDPLMWTSTLVLNAISLGILYLMLAKPDVWGSLFVPAVAMLLSGVLSVPMWRSSSVSRNA
jgi:hypothetical protein